MAYFRIPAEAENPSHGIRHYMNARILTVLTISLPALAFFCGCGSHESAPAATQVAARVNDDEITVHQINHFLAQMQNITPESEDQAKREILDRLIDQHLARQMAVEAKLDRSPNVVMAIEAARNEILARAYLEQLAAALPKPASWETKLYYMENPELFARRRLFDLEEFAFVANSPIAGRLGEQVSKARTMQEIAGWLRSQGINFVANHRVLAAEQIALELLPRVQAMKEGQIQLFDAGGGRFLVVRMVGSKADPLDEATATPRIQQFLLNRHTSEAIAKKMKETKDRAKIEFVGEFAAGATGKARAKAEAGARTGEPAESRAGIEAPAGTDRLPTEQSRK